jgi:hypothetical protein
MEEPSTEFGRIGDEDAFNGSIVEILMAGMPDF